jgi:hypothetical protein
MQYTRRVKEPEIMVHFHNKGHEVIVRVAYRITFATIVEPTSCNRLCIYLQCDAEPGVIKITHQCATYSREVRACANCVYV